MHDGPLVNRHKDAMGQPISWMKMTAMRHSPHKLGKSCYISFNPDALSHARRLKEEKKRKNIRLGLPRDRRRTKNNSLKEVEGPDGSLAAYSRGK